MFMLKVFILVSSPMILFVALLLISGQQRKVSDKVDRWISTDRFFGCLDSFVSIERFLLNRLTGVLIFTGSSYIMIYSLFCSDLTGWPAHVSKAFSVILGLTGVLIGVGLILRAETIGKINDKLSTWVSTERLFKPLDKKIETDDWFDKHNILVGILLLIACLFINLNLWQ